eukprot:694910_1
MNQRKVVEPDIANKGQRNRNYLGQSDRFWLKDSVIRAYFHTYERHKKVACSYEHNECESKMRREIFVQKNQTNRRRKVEKYERQSQPISIPSFESWISCCHLHQYTSHR